MELNSYYDNVWKNEDLINWSRFEHTCHLIPRNADINKVLDLGSGVGYFSEYLVEQRLFTIEQITCADISSFAVESCRNSGLKAITTDIEKAPTQDKYDLIFFLEAIEHVFKPSEVLKNIYKSLNDEGYLIISTPNYSRFLSRIKVLLGDPIEDPDSHHISFFNINSLKKYLNDNKFLIDYERNITLVESLGVVGRLLTRMGVLHKKRYNQYNFIKTPFFDNLLADGVMIRAKKINESVRIGL
jgi:2-polyprenyl-3-methyl-5-hydroxy-6-metoxy-1,4-benzoquinol methylase